MMGEEDEEAVATKAELLYPLMRITGLARPVAPDPAEYQQRATARCRLSRDHIRNPTRTRTPKTERGRSLRAVPRFLRGSLLLISSDSLIHGLEVNSLTPHAARLQHCWISSPSPQTRNTWALPSPEPFRTQLKEGSYSYGRGERPLSLFGSISALYGSFNPVPDHTALLIHGLEDESNRNPPAWLRQLSRHRIVELGVYTAERK